MINSQTEARAKCLRPVGLRLPTHTVYDIDSGWIYTCAAAAKMT